MERVDFHAREEFAVAFDRRSESESGCFLNAEKSRSDEVQGESGKEREEIDVFKMPQIMREARHRNGASEQEREDTAPVAGIAIAPMDEIAENRRKVRSKSGAYEDGRNPEGGSRKKGGVNDGSDGKDRRRNRKNEMTRKVTGFVGIAEGAINVNGERVEVVAGKGMDGIGVDGKIGRKEFVGDAKSVYGFGAKEHDGEDGELFSRKIGSNAIDEPVNDEPILVALDGDEAARGQLEENSGEGFAVGIADQDVPQRGG